MDVDDSVALALLIVRRCDYQTQVEPDDDAQGCADTKPGCQYATQSVDVGR